MLTWWCTAPPSPRTSPLRPVKVPSSSSRSPLTVFADASRRSRLFVARRNGVGIYTVTAMLSSARLARSFLRSPRTAGPQPRDVLRLALPSSTDSPRGARRRASAAAARLALPLAQIPLAGVGQHGHHELLGGELRGDGARSERRGAGGDAHEQALLAREPSRPRDRVFVADHDDPVDDTPVQDAGHEGCSDPLDRVGPRPAAREHGRIRRLDGDHSGAGELLLEHLTDTGHRAAGTDARDERVQVPADGVQNLQRRGAPVRLGVRRVLELLGHEVTRVLPAELLGRVDRAGHALDRGRQMELGTEPREEPLALHTHVVGHRENEPVALHRGGHGEPYARVAAGGLYDRRARLEAALLLCGIEHRHGDPVLDAPARIDRLELRDDARTARLRKPVQADHRRVADQLQHRRCDLRSRRHMWYIARTALRRACARAARSPNVTRSTTSETALPISSHSSLSSYVSSPFRPPVRRRASSGA